MERRDFPIQSARPRSLYKTLMAQSPELRNFCESWREKSAAYSPDDLGGAFDRFIASYVVFNRLYVETTHRLARRGVVRLRDNFPDAQAAKDYITQYRTAGVLTQAWDADAATAAAIRQIAGYLREHRFALKLDPVTAERRPTKTPPSPRCSNLAEKANAQKAC